MATTKTALTRAAAAFAFLACLPLPSARTAQSDSGAKVGTEATREMQLINRSTVSCATIAMRSPYQSGLTGAALIQAAMSGCPWHGPPQTYDEYIRAIMAGARAFDRTHPDAK